MDAEVLVVGHGPVGQLLAGLLGRAGVRTLVLEAAPALHPLPRAAAIDDEGLRILQAVGLADAARAGMLVDVPVAFVTRRGREVRLVDAHDTANGQPFLSLLHQPALEGLLDAHAREHATVRFGAEVVDVVQDAESATAVLADGSEHIARYLIACDGGRSPIREGLGVGFGGSTFAQPWLVVDLLLRGPRAAPPVMRFLGDPTRPMVSVPMGEGRHRWEFMALPGEDLEALVAPARVRALLAPHVDLAGVEIERATVYTFHARTAARWRERRVLLAGDAAHVMPPFAGQGMCSGLRDAQNLAWKLAAVLRDGAPPELLDTYEQERRPHVVAMTALAERMGAVQTRRPRAALLRDGVLRGLSEAPLLGPRARAGGPRPGGRYRSGAFGPGGGRLFPQPRVGGTLLDDLLPAGGWALLGASPDPRSRLSRAAATAFAGVVALTVPPRLLGRDELVVLRPDRYVFARDRADGGGAAAAFRRFLG